LNTSAASVVFARSIPEIVVDALFGGASPERDAADRQIFAAATRIGFMTIVFSNGSFSALSSTTRGRLLSIFTLDPGEIRKLWRQKFDPSHSNVYRGWFAAQSGAPLGPDVAYGDGVIDGSDPLREATPLPAEPALPGWRAAVADYYRAMERVAVALTRSP
jgi:isopenicillin N synthase-like dioxygenase